MVSRFREVVDRHPVVTFFALTYLLSWTVWAPLVFGPGRPGLRTTLLIMLGGFGPAVAALILTWVRGESVRGWFNQILRWRVPLRYWVVALVLPAVFALAGSSLDILVFGGAFDPTPLAALASYPIGMLLVFFVGGGNEEPGWRGFALPRLQARYSALTASLIIGVGWVVWHLPLFVVPGSAQANLPLQFYAIAVVAESVVFTWLYNETGGSVLVAMVLHASVNNSPLFYLAGGSEAIRSPTGYGVVALVIVVAASILVVVYGPERLSNGEIPRGPPEVLADSGRTPPSHPTD
ncbi:MULTISPECIES: CPBP family intramembrane glutamic endopeptidase [Haloferax]|nr:MULTISPECIES: type II CAAX endopeptidase family protein [Haloferax]